MRAEDRALIRVTFTKGFGSFRRPFARFLEGAILDRRAGARTRHNRNFNRQQPPTYGPKPVLARELMQIGHTTARKARFA